MVASDGPAPLTDIVCCPRCAGALADADGGYRCDAVRAASIRSSGAFPACVDDPALWRTIWLRRLDDYTSEHRVARAGAAAARRRRRSCCRGRGSGCCASRAGSRSSSRRSRRCSSRSTRGPTRWSRPAIPSRPEPGPQLAILECYEHLFRDWVWGERECALTLDFVEPLVPAGLERVAVYGAGAGRLAVDIHQTLRGRRARSRSTSTRCRSWSRTSCSPARPSTCPSFPSTRTPTTSSSSRATSSARSSCATGSRSCSRTRSGRPSRPDRWTRS